MLDMSWGELMVIGGVALIVIGPKDLPKALRTVGQVTTKVRRLAGEFQAQFNEAMREAELDDVKRDLEAMNRDVKSSTAAAFNPIETIRDEFRNAVEGRPTTAVTNVQGQPAIQASSPETALADVAAATGGTHVESSGPSMPAPRLDAAPAETVLPPDEGAPAPMPVEAVEVAPLTDITGPGLESGVAPDEKAAPHGSRDALPLGHGRE